MLILKLEKRIKSSSYQRLKGVYKADVSFKALFENTQKDFIYEILYSSPYYQYLFAILGRKKKIFHINGAIY